jgi:3-deoxy-7-phosphoheptulonate synthase
MIIVLRPDVTEEQINHIVEKVQKLGLKPHLSRGIARHTLRGFPGRRKGYASTGALQTCFAGI